MMSQSCWEYGTRAGVVFFSCARLAVNQGCYLISAGRGRYMSSCTLNPKKRKPRHVYVYTAPSGMDMQTLSSTLW